MKYTISKAVKHGTCVTLRSNKFVVCSDIKKILGVYNDGYQKQIMSLDGDITTFTIPSGVVTWGQAFVRKA